MIEFYGYPNCSTCRKAKQALQASNVAIQERDITATPPPKALLRAILDDGKYPLKALFNRSGQLYRQMNMSQKITTLSDEELIDLLSQHGKLVKRPIVSDGRQHTVGFDPQRFADTWR